jgi:hypothetical protein
MGIRFRIKEIINGHNLQRFRISFQNGFEHLSADAAETINPQSYHCSSFVIQNKANGQLGLYLYYRLCKGHAP